MNNSIALPRIRRKKRKPPSPLFWLTLFSVVFNLGAAALQVVFYSIGDGAYHIFFLGLHSFLLAYVWPTFKWVWNNWRNDD